MKLILFILLTMSTHAQRFDFVQKLQENFERNLTITTLDNGLKIMIYEKHDVPIVKTRIGFKVGSVDEHAGNFGCAHMLEHMLFKGNKVYGTKDLDKEGEITKAIETLAYKMDKENLLEHPNRTILKLYKKRMKKLVTKLNKVVIKSPYNPIYSQNGGKGLNAYTNTDNTVYIVNIPSNKLELWALLESSKFTNPVLRSYYPERDVVIEERRMRTDGSPRGQLWEQFMLSAYTAHNYRNPVIGFMSELQTLAKSTLTDFFNQYYAPNNATIVLVGDVYPKQAIPLIKKYFGSWQAKKEFPRTHITEPKQLGERHTVISSKAQPFFYNGYHIPKVNTLEGSALGLFAQTIAGGKSSIMYKKLVLEKQIAASVWAFAGAGGQRYSPLFMTGGSPKSPHTNKEVNDAIDQVLQSVFKDGISLDELNRVKRRYKSEYIYAMDSSDNIASLLLDNEMNLGTYKEIFNDLDRVLAITPKQLVDIAKKHLIKSNKTTATLETKK
ncbi:MAG: insulinase family protein [Candidatus Cloacimonetes bacterium]|nr:insulinase family protein [Candidatus Cloacimonadota bacterium]